MASIEEVAIRKIIDVADSDKEGNERYLEFYKIVSDIMGKVEEVIEHRTIDICIESLQKQKKY